MFGSCDPPNAVFSVEGSTCICLFFWQDLFKRSVIADIGMELSGTAYLEAIIEDKNICCSAIQLVMADRCLQTGYSWHDDAG